MKSNVKGPLLIMCTAVLWSFGGLLIKFISWDAMTIVGMRSAFAALVMIIYMRRVHITFSRPVIMGALSMSGTTVLFVFANKLTTAANAIVLQYTGPIFIVLISIIFLKKRARALDIVSTLIVFAGMGLFFFDRLQADALLGNILACFSGITFAGVFLANKAPGAKPEEAVLLGHIINAAAGLPFAVTQITFDPAAWGAIALLGIFQLGIAYVLFSIGIKNTPPITASLIATLEPLLNPVWVLLNTGEAPGIWALIGGVIVIATVLIYNISDTKQSRREALLKSEITSPT
jgi:drug/metabolite transporter (DMT)-like permease